MLFNGKYMRCAPYSPDLKSIERGFANIKGFLREHETDAILNPIYYINYAFETYSFNGLRSSAGKKFIYLLIHKLTFNKAYEHWISYRENHKNF